jgi:xanthine dehydrogenase accessory factor
MGSRRTTERRNERLLEEGVTEDQLARVHAPIGLKIGSRSPEEVAVAIAAQIIGVFNESTARVSPTKAAAA